MASSAPRPCRSCGAALAPEQDWCLECGTARPGRLGRAPGWKPVAAVAGLTLALVGGASVAAYAGLEQEAGLSASAPVGADASPVAGGLPAIPPSVTPGVPVKPVDPPATTTAPPATGTPIDPVTPGTGLGTGTGTDLGTGTGTGTGTARTGTGTGVGTGTTGAGTGTTGTGTGTTGGGTTGSGGGTGGGTETDQEAEPDAADDPAEDPDALVPLALDAGASKAFDPYGRSTVASDPAQATDGKRSTAWEATVPGEGPLQVGLLVDLESTKAIRGIELRTTTPGFTVEVYGTDSAELPNDVTDPRWAHPTDRAKVDGADRKGDPARNGTERILLGKTRRYRYVLLWITVPPAEGRTVRLADVKILA
jgi:hypothetical protein